METLTLADTARLEIVETLDVHAPESLPSRLLSWFGIAPRTAQAKASEGRMPSATFSIDGQNLYLSGNEIVVGDTVEDISGRGFGLMWIDVGNGEITAPALSGTDVAGMLPLPDSRRLRPESEHSVVGQRGRQGR